MRKRCAAIPVNYILCFSFWDINELASLAPVPAVYIYSSSEAFDEEMHMDQQRLRNWLRHFGVESHGLGEAQDGPLHASGHASGTELLDIIRQIRPSVSSLSTRKTRVSSWMPWQVKTLR